MKTDPNLVRMYFYNKIHGPIELHPYQVYIETAKYFRISIGKVEKIIRNGCEN